MLRQVNNIILFLSVLFANVSISWANETKIFPSQDIDAFADSVSISGNRALVGGKRAGSVNGSGAAYIFEFDGNDWNEVAILTASDFDFGDEFGNAVSLLGDRAAIGTAADNNGTGAVYIFEFNGNQWLETAKIIAADGQDDDNFGFAIDLANDKILIGSPMHDLSSSPLDMNKGAAYIYNFDGNSWQQTIKLTPTTDVGALFGNAVSFSDDVAVIGAPNDGLLSGTGGSVFIFELIGNTWSQQDRLKASDIINTAGFFGHAVSHSGDHIIVGDHIRTRAYMYQRQGNNGWNETQIIIGAVDSFFAFSVGLSGDIALIGDPNHDNLTGEVFVYKREGDNWSSTQTLMANDGLQSDQFGFVLDYDGNQAIIGAPGGNSIDPNRPDAAYIYTFDEVFKNGFEAP